MKTTTSKENSTPSRSSQPFFSKKGEGTFLSSKNEQEQPFFSPNPDIQRSLVSSFFAGGHNFVTLPFFSPRSQPIIQTKLTINEPDDKYEQEADAMADWVMRMSAVPSEEEGMEQTKPLPVTSIQRKCSACEQEEKVQRQEMEEEEPLQTKPLMPKAEGGGYTASPQLSSQLNSSKSRGNPLPGQTLASMNQAFGADFSAVRIHTDSQAAEMSQVIQAKAFTHGSDIYFNRGQYSPESPQGKRLLGHELAHVLQQGGKGGYLSKNIFRQPAPPEVCPFDETRQQQLLSQPLPWGIQSGDSTQDIVTRRQQMLQNQDFLQFINNCIPLDINDVNLLLIIQNAEYFSIQDLINGERSGQPYPIISKIEGGRTFEAIADPRALPGSGDSVTVSKYRITGGDASQGATVNMPGLATPQCGDNCTAQERQLTPDQFRDEGTPVRSCCSSEECSVINDRIGVAKRHTELAIERMKRGDAMDGAINRHFNNSDQNTYLDVLEGLYRILPDLSFSQHAWVCREFGKEVEGCMSTTLEGAKIGGRAHKWRIMFCFEDGDIPWEHTLHEIAHTAYAMGSETYFGASGYPPDDALQNADSYAMFVKEVGAPDWKEEHPQRVGLRGIGGMSVTDGQAMPVLGARFEWTPMGPGMRVVDFVLGANILWLPNKGIISEEGETTGHEFLGSIDGVARFQAFKWLTIDIGAGPAILFNKDQKFSFGGVATRFGATWKPSDKASGVTLGADLNAVFNEVSATPGQLIIGLGVGYEWGGDPRRRDEIER